MISIVLATHNEERNLVSCLEAIKDIADEIIITDGESTDNTVEIAKKYNAQIIQTTNKKNFHINKQIAIDAAKGDLILQLDADEVVDQELKQFILHIHKQLKQNKKINYSAWWIKRKNYFMGKWLSKGGQYPDPVIRLFIKDKAFLPCKDVHEQMKVKGKIGWAKGHLLHYSNPLFKDYLRKFKTYTSFEASQLKKKNIKKNIRNSIRFFIYLPIKTFIKLYIRHKGFVDGCAGFSFAFFSGVFHAVTYYKYLKMK